MNNATPSVRERQVNIRLSEEEADRLDFVCKHYGLNGANLFRMFLRREEQAIRGTAEVPPAPPSKPAKPRGKR